MKASTQEVYLIERDANSGTVNFTIKEKICDLTATTDGELVEYIFENPLPLKNTEFLAIKNTGHLYLQNTEVQGNYYYITGRKKNVIVTKNGKNIFPEEVEAYLSESEYIKECVVYGKEVENEIEPKVCAIIVPCIAE